MAKSGMRHDQSLHCHGVLLHDVADAGIGIDYDLISKTLQTLPVQGLVESKALAKAPVSVHQRKPDRRVGIEHLLRSDDLDLHRIDIQPEFVERDFLNRVKGLTKRAVVPVGAAEQRRGCFKPRHRHGACVRHERPPLKIIRGRPRKFATDRRRVASQNARGPGRLRYRHAINRCLGQAR